MYATIDTQFFRLDFLWRCCALFRLPWNTEKMGYSCYEGKYLWRNKYQPHFNPTQVLEKKDFYGFYGLQIDQNLKLFIYLCTLSFFWYPTFILKKKLLIKWKVFLSDDNNKYSFSSLRLSCFLSMAKTTMWRKLFLYQTFVC